MKKKIKRIKKYFSSEHWKWHDTILGQVLGWGECLLILLIFNVNAADLWTLFRFHIVDLALICFAAGMSRAAWVLMKRRNYKIKVDNKWDLINRNWVKWVMMIMAIWALALVNPEFTRWFFSVFI